MAWEDLEPDAWVIPSQRGEMGRNDTPAHRCFALQCQLPLGMIRSFVNQPRKPHSLRLLMRFDRKEKIYIQMLGVCLILAGSLFNETDKAFLVPFKMRKQIVLHWCPFLREVGVSFSDFLWPFSCTNPSQTVHDVNR